MINVVEKIADSFIPLEKAQSEYFELPIRAGVVDLKNVCLFFLGDLLKLIYQSPSSLVNYPLQKKAFDLAQINTFLPFYRIYHMQSVLLITKAERKYLFYPVHANHNSFHDHSKEKNLPQKLLCLSSAVYELHIKGWVFTITVDYKGKSERQRNNYIPSLGRLVVFPRFYMPENIKAASSNIIEHMSSKNTLEKIIKYKPSNTCPCIVSGKNYDECCQILFIDDKDLDRPEYFGFHFIDLIENIKQYFELKKDAITYDKSINDTIRRKELSLQEIFKLLPKKVPLIIQQEKIPYWHKKMIVSIIEELNASGYLNTVTYIPDRRNIIVRAAFSIEEQIQQGIDLWARNHTEGYLDNVENVMKKLLNSYSNYEVQKAFKSYLFLEQDEIEMILESIILYRQGKYRAACFILIPQIERIIRELSIDLTGYKLALTKNSSSFPYQREYLTLKDLIEQLFSIQVTQEDNRPLVMEYLKRVLTEGGQQFNLRNELSHGFERVPFGRREYLVSLYLIVLILYGFGTES
jgi:ribosomal protein S8